MARLHTPRILRADGRWYTAEGDFQELHDPGLPLFGSFKCSSAFLHPLTLLQIQFARANALASYKASSLDDIAGVSASLNAP